MRRGLGGELATVDVFALGLAALAFLPLNDLEETVEQLCTDGRLAPVGGRGGDGHTGDASRVVGTLARIEREEFAIHGVDDLLERDGAILGWR